MLSEGERRATDRGITDVRWVQGTAEELPHLDIGPCRLITFGQSFHRTDRRRVAEHAFDALEPGGSIALISHAREGRPEPPDPGLPRIPHDQIKDLVIEYLGAETKDYLAFWAEPKERFADTLARSRFGGSRTVFAPGRPDLVVDIDAVVADCFSKSYSAPSFFGDALEEFEADLRRLLLSQAPDGHFWDWPGDTEIILGVKTGSIRSNQSLG